MVGASTPKRCLRQKQPKRSRGSGGDRVQWTKQGAAAGAALRFLQAPAVARRKNRLSARGKRGDRVLRSGGAAPGSEPRQGRARRAGVTTMGGGWVKIKNKLIDSVFSAVRAAWPVWTLRWPRGGCAAEPLPAAETGEAEQGQRSVFARALRRPQQKQGTATRKGGASLLPSCA